MKYIFDFDDVLFNNTAQFKEHAFRFLATLGVPEVESRKYYLEVREKEFSLRNFIETLFNRYNIKIDTKEVYKKIMSECSKCINISLIELVKKIGKENCYIVSNGSKEFQEDKIKYSNIGALFKDVFIVPGTKKEVIKKICEENKDSRIIFIDDKLKFIEDVDAKDCPNLTMLVYDENTLVQLEEINK